MDFRPLSLAEKPLLDAALRRHPPEVSELTFTNLFCWRGRRQVRLAEEGGWLLLLAEEGGRRFFLPPVGGGDVAAAAGLMRRHARDAAFTPRIERAPASLAVPLREAGWTAQEERDQFDYVYEAGALALLPGRHYDGKRNLVRQATAAHRCEYRPITAALAHDCLGLEAAWCDLRRCAGDPGLAAEQEAIAECFRRWEEFALLGGAVLVDGRLAAFAIGERLSPETAVVHFEKADPAVRGLSQLVNQWYCREALAAFRFVNREQDLGLPGLRQAKQSYLPHHLVRKYAVSAPAGGPGGD